MVLPSRYWRSNGTSRATSGDLSPALTPGTPWSQADVTGVISGNARWGGALSLCTSLGHREPGYISCPDSGTFLNRKIHLLLHIFGLWSQQDGGGECWWERVHNVLGERQHQLHYDYLHCVKKKQLYFLVIHYLYFKSISDEDRSELSTHYESVVKQEPSGPVLMNTELLVHAACRKYPCILLSLFSHKREISACIYWFSFHSYQILLWRV